MTIAQGKIVDAVLETAVNTDLPGEMRAIVSRDVFAESGRQIMIPKGSRLIGTYNTSVARGQARVMIIWTRLIRPDGLDIAIGSGGVDALGRAGVEGSVDNKYAEIFSAAMLTSVLDIGVAVAVDALSNQGSTTTNANGTTSSGSAAAPAGSCRCQQHRRHFQGRHQHHARPAPDHHARSGHAGQHLRQQRPDLPANVATDKQFVE